MTEQQKNNLEEVIFSMELEGFIIPDDEIENLIGILDGKYTFSEILENYILEVKSYRQKTLSKSTEINRA